jgi:ribonuclease Z
MAELVVLGTAWALPSASQENTYMALVGAHQTILVDCAGSPYRQLLLAGLDPARLDTLILTHSHPDHIYGVPSLLMSLRLAGRTAPLSLYAPADTVLAVQTMLPLFHLEDWPGMFAVEYHLVPLDRPCLLFDGPDFRVAATAVHHLLPAIGLRAEDHRGGGIWAYSGDTEPSDAVIQLARGASLLVHEAAGMGLGHSSAAQAGAVAQAAQAARLVLVHYGAEQALPEQLAVEAQSTFAGQVFVARDFDRFEW